MSLSKSERRKRIKLRIRKTVNGTSERPRVAIFRSNKQIYAQVIDDVNGKTLFSASSREKGIASADKGNKTEQAALVGKLLASKCKEAGIENIVFDRGGYKYHGRVKSLAEAAREGGLKF
ncbi:MAG TPA: 50S ribosomal protein L18 [Bacteroidales bacterium]|nr:50S ribosomal protein L18 [Bacteroidales bacterium]